MGEKTTTKETPFSSHRDVVKYFTLSWAANQTILLEISSFTGTGQVTPDALIVWLYFEVRQTKTKLFCFIH